MKKLIIVACLLALAGCETRTDYGECKGAFDQRSPQLEYKLSIRNTVLGVVFFETIFVPVIVVANDAVCPVGPASKTPQ